MRNANLMSCVETALKRHKVLRPAEPELLLLLTDGIHGLLKLTTDQRELLREANAAQMHITILQLGDDPWVASCLMELANAMGKCSINSMCDLTFCAGDTVESIHSNQHASFVEFFNEGMNDPNLLRNGTVEDEVAQLGDALEQNEGGRGCRGCACTMM